MMSSLFLEDFQVGQVFTGDRFHFTGSDFADFAAVSGDRHPMHTPSQESDDASLIGHGPLGLARYFGSVYESGILADSVVALLETNWRYLRPLRIGEQLRFVTVITGWRRTSDPSRGVLRRSVRLLSDNDDVVQEGEASVLVRAASASALDDPSSADPLGPAWTRELVKRLESNADFYDATQLFDGCIALASARNTVQLRIYKGEVIDTSGRTPRGPSFTLSATDLIWAELLTGERNDFVARASRSQFAVTGDLYTYLQLTKALHLLFEAARGLYTTGDGR